jgi:hypothetical protein
MDGPKQEAPAKAKQATTAKGKGKQPATKAPAPKRGRGAKPNAAEVLFGDSDDEAGSAPPTPAPKARKNKSAASTPRSDTRRKVVQCNSDQSIRC